MGEITLGLLSCLCLSTSGIAILCLSLRTSYWIISEIDTSDYQDTDSEIVSYNNSEIHCGLFKTCDGNGCDYLDDLTGKIVIELKGAVRIVQGVLTTAIACSGITSLLILIQHVMSCGTITASRIIYWTCVILYNLIATLNVVGVVYFQQLEERYREMMRSFYKGDVISISYGYSFHFAWVSIALIVIGGVIGYPVAIHYIVKRRNECPKLGGNPPPCVQLGHDSQQVTLECNVNTICKTFNEYGDHSENTHCNLGCELDDTDFEPILMARDEGRF